MDANTFDDIRTATISLVIIMNITLNVLVIAVIVRYPQLREDRTTLFMFSLTLSDLACGCMAMPISAAVCSRLTPNVRKTSRYLPKIQAVLLTWFVVNSLHSLCWVTVCKMIAITQPLRYEQVLTRNRCYFIIGCIWLTGVVSGTLLAPFTATWNFKQCIFEATLSSYTVGLIMFVDIFAIVCPAIVIVYSTTRIFFAILRTHRQITAQVNSIGGENSNFATTPSLTLKSIRSGRNVLIICLAFVILTMPFAAYVVMDAISLTTPLPLSFAFISTWVILSNSSVNSLMYILLFQSVREKTAQTLRDICERCTLW